jgi:hypothetical protein
MVRIARRDTYGLEDMGGGVKVRRRIFAGKPIPDHLEVESGAFEGEVDAPLEEVAAAEPEPEPEPDTEAKEQAKPTGGGRRTRRSGG